MTYGCKQFSQQSRDILLTDLQHEGIGKLSIRLVPNPIGDCFFTNSGTYSLREVLNEEELDLVYYFYDYTQGSFKELKPGGLEKLATKLKTKLRVITNSSDNDVAKKYPVGKEILPLILNA